MLIALGVIALSETSGVKSASKKKEHGYVEIKFGQMLMVHE